MKKTSVRAGIGGLALVALLAGPAAVAETLNLKGDLKGSNEVPPTTSPGSGKVEATYDTASKKLSWKGTYTGLTGPATAAHFHGPTPASPPAANGGVVLPIAASSSPFEGSATLNDAQAAELTAGRWYLNIHTQANPGGEIRGQVTK